MRRLSSTPQPIPLPASTDVYLAIETREAHLADPASTLDDPAGKEGLIVYEDAEGQPYLRLTAADMLWLKRKGIAVP